MVIYVKSTIKLKHLANIQKKYNDLGVEVVLCQIQLPSSVGSTIIVSVYRPPNCGKIWFDHFNDLIINILPLGRLIIMGDLNCNLLRPDLSPAKDLLASLELADTSVHSVFPTRICSTCSTCLDIIALPSDIVCLKYSTLSNSASDHYPVCAELENCQKSKITPIIKRSFKKANINRLKSRVKCIEITDSADANQQDPNRMVESFNVQLSAILDEELPIRRFPRRKQNLPWVTDEIKILMQQRDKLSRVIAKSTIKDTDKLKELQILRKRVRSNIRASAKKYGTKKLQNSDSKQCWNFIRQVTFTTQKEKQLSVDINDLNNHFASIVQETHYDSYITTSSCDTIDCFSIKPMSINEIVLMLRKFKSTNSVTCDGLTGFIVKLLASEIAPNIRTIFSTSLDQGIFPDIWKYANICPIYKQKGSKSDSTNYRPISILPVLGRCFEKLVATQLTQFCDSLRIIPEEQFGFRKYSNCEMALLAALENWYKYIDQGEFVGALLIDLSKAFDTVPHKLLLKELQDINFSCKALTWFKSYLTGRFQRVSSNHGTTPFLPVSRGVPQGSCLSPILFNIFIRDIPKCCSADVIQFADDITESEHHESLDVLVTRLQDSFKDIKNFCTNKGLCINDDKTQFIIFKSASKRIRVDPTLTIENVKLEPLINVKLLGVTLDRHLTFGSHIHNVVVKCRGLLGLLRRVSLELPKKLLLLFTGLIRPHLEYASAILDSASVTNKTKLDTIQKIASRIICGVGSDAHSAPLLEELDLKSLEDRRKNHIINIVENCIKGTCHPAFSSMFAIDSDDHIKTGTKPRTIVGAKQLYFRGANIYNHYIDN